MTEEGRKDARCPPLLLALWVFFAATTVVAFAISVWIYTTPRDPAAFDEQGNLIVTNLSRGLSPEELALFSGQPGEPGPVGEPGPDGDPRRFRRIEQKYLRWESGRHGAFIQFDVDAYGYFCENSGFGELTLTGEMQVKNPPTGKSSVLRSVFMWVRVAFVHDQLLDADHIQDHKHKEHGFEVPRGRVFTGWRASDSVASTNTRDDQEDFEVIAHDSNYRRRDARYDGNELDYADTFHDYDRAYDHDHDGHEHEFGREFELIEFRIIVSTGDEQVGVTPFETVLPLHRRRHLVCVEK